MDNKEDFQIEMQQLQQQIRDYLQKHWQFFLVEGLFFILLGIGAMVIPQFFTEAIVILLGWIMLFGGIAHVGRALVFSDMPGFGLWLFMGLLQIIAGYLFITTPLVGVLTITLLMTLFFAFEGIAKISLALLMRPLAHWGLMLFSGASSLVFALIIIISWSETAHWLLGVFLGINMIFMGFSLVKMSWHHKSGS
ncbi:MAG: HdeD family acid-resistance protein [Methylovulum miyakonense]|uniref:HdeD family acid-resistance protein n=1 Tax=Methylovulum miyakonense TaxID=645578 RepID=UPI003BB65AF9